MKFNKKVKAIAVQHFPAIKAKITKGVRAAAGATNVYGEDWNRTAKGDRSNLNVLGDALEAATSKKKKDRSVVQTVKYPAASERKIGHEPVAKVAHYASQTEYNKNRKLMPPINQIPRNKLSQKRVL